MLWTFDPKIYNPLSCTTNRYLCCKVSKGRIHTTKKSIISILTTTLLIAHHKKEKISFTKEIHCNVFPSHLYLNTIMEIIENETIKNNLQWVFMSRSFIPKFSIGQLLTCRNFLLFLLQLKW